MVTLNIENLKSYFESYKQNFTKNFPNEIYKWEAVKHFQENWDINAADFKGMLTEAMSKTSNLLAANKYFPLGMLQRFCETDENRVREMFKDLYDEGKDVFERIVDFKNSSDDLLKTRKELGLNKDESQHFQTANSISTYLWLKYPDKYYIYKHSEIKKAIECLESSASKKQGLKKETLYDSLELFNQITDFIKNDSDYVDNLNSMLNADCYNDQSMHLSTIDFVYYMNNYYKDSNDRSLWIYSPGENAYKWEDCLRDNRMYLGWDDLGDFKQYDSKEQITKKLQEFGDDDSSYKNDSLAVWNFLHTVKPGDIVYVKKGRNKLLGKGVVKGEYCHDDSLDVYNNYRTVEWIKRGEWDCKTTHALKTLTDITSYKDYIEELDSLMESKKIDEQNEDSSVKKWWLNANPSIWSAGLGWAVGATVEYTLMNDNGHKRRIYQNYLDAKAGDKVVCYESTPTKQVIALAEVTFRDETQIGFKKIANLTTPIDYADLKDIPELAKMEFFVNPNGSLFKLTDQEYNVILDLVSISDSPREKENLSKYTEKEFLEEVFMSPSDMHTLEYLLINKKNIILQGAPGVGKTFSAKRLAYKMMGCKDDKRICTVQFHQNYSYEDFVLGYKPVENGFKLQEGKFYNFCLLAANDPNNVYYFIIDEINRGNVSKIFGELLMAIECGYRGTKIRLAYGEKEFSVPENLCIIGMMNTADRSLALIDYALRRRFSFFKMNPGFDTDGFIKRSKAINNPKYTNLVETVKRLNIAISEDASLGEGFQIGHSYFCKNGEVNDTWLQTLVQYDIIPMLEEYWFDNVDEVNNWSKSLMEAIK